MFLFRAARTHTRWLHNKLLAKIMLNFVKHVFAWLMLFHCGSLRNFEMFFYFVILPPFSLIRDFPNLVLTESFIRVFSFLFLVILLEHLLIVSLTFRYSASSSSTNFQFPLDTSSKSSHCFIQLWIVQCKLKWQNNPCSYVSVLYTWQNIQNYLQLTEWRLRPQCIIIIVISFLISQ